MRSHAIPCPHCGANLAARETHGPAFPPRERWRNLEREVRERMHPGYLQVLKRLRGIPVGQDFTVFHLGYRGGKAGTNVLPVIQAAEKAGIVGFTGQRTFGPGGALLRRPRLRYLVYRRLC